MLGLSSGLTSVSAPSSRVLLETYTADWSSGIDGWQNYAYNDAEATITRVASFEGKSNVLKVEFNADETGTTGIFKSNAFSAALRKGDYIEVTCNIYLDSDPGLLTDRWNGTDDVQTGIQMPGVTTDLFEVAQDGWVSLSTPSEDGDSDLMSSSSDYAYIYFQNAYDRPKDGAVFYVHNYVAKLYRSQLFT